MNARSLGLICGAMLLALVVLPLNADEPAAKADPVATAAPAATAAATPLGVRSSLFDGKSLDGWIVTGCTAGVEEGHLVIQKGDGFVRTMHPVRDFVLEISWRNRRSENWDSGIYFRAELPPEGKPWPSRYQINLKQGLEGNLVGNKLAVSKNLVKPGEWNRAKLTVICGAATMEINGQPAWQIDGLAATAGYIGLQCEEPGGGQFEFKDIYLTELGYRSLFNGRDLTGWEPANPAMAACWSVAGETIECSGEPGSWLRSTESYADFNLRLEYRLADGGNSGVFIRVPKDGKHHGPWSGLEVQVLDDHAEKHRTLKPYQYSASLYDIVGADPKTSRIPGEWNRLEIDAFKTAYEIIHNGVVVVKTNVEKHPALAERLIEGFLGLQNHRTKVAFRHLRIGPSRYAADDCSAKQ